MDKLAGVLQPVSRIARDLSRDLQRAHEKKIPLFLLVFYRNERDKLALIEELKRDVGEKGLFVQTFDPAHRPEHGIGKLYPLLSASAPGTVALLTNLPRATGGGPDEGFLDYLNLQRDRIARDRLLLILFVHGSEVEKFLARAGDLWDYRSHIYELEHPGGSGGDGFWQEISQSSAALPLSESSRAEIAERIGSVQALVERTRGPEERAGLLLDLSRWLGRREAARPSLESALEGIGYLGATRDKLRADLEHAAGYALRNLNHLPEALVHYEECLKIRRAVGDRIGESFAHINISQVYDAWGCYNEALKHLEEGLKLSREFGDRAGEAAALSNIAEIYKAWGRYDEALSRLTEGLAIMRDAGDHRGAAIALNNIALVYDAWRRYPEALAQLTDSLKISRELGHRSGEAVTLNNIAQIYDAWGRYDEALAHLTESLKISREIGDCPGEALTSWNLASEYQRRGDIARALPLARRAVEIEKATSHPDLEKDRENLRRLQQLSSLRPGQSRKSRQKRARTRNARKKSV